MGEDFDAKNFASSAIQSQMVGETLSKLTNGIALLDKELYTQVVGNYEDLLSQATGIEALESELCESRIYMSSWGGVTPIDSIHSFPTGIKVRSRGQGDIIGVVKQSTRNYGSGKVGQEARQDDNCAFAHA